MGPLRTPTWPTWFQCALETQLRTPHPTVPEFIHLVGHLVERSYAPEFTGNRLAIPMLSLVETRSLQVAIIAVPIDDGHRE